MGTSESKDPTSTNISGSKRIIVFLARVAAVTTFLASCAGIIVLGINWLQLQSQLRNAEVDAKSRNTEVSILIDQRDLLVTVAVSNSGLESLQSTQIALNEEMATIAPNVPTIPVVSRTSTYTPSSTPVNTPTPTASFTPTTASTPTPSPVPTETPLILDDFTNGKSDLWQMIYGSPLIVNNALTFEEVTLMVLDEQWTDVEVSFDVSNMQCQQHVGSRGVTVALRYQNPNNMVALRIFNQDDCAATWFLIKDGKWNKLPNSTFPLPPRDSNGVRHWVMNVQGNTYNSPFGIPVVIEDFSMGGVALLADPNVIIDNFKVSLFTP